jgi:hypothetical protein
MKLQGSMAWMGAKERMNWDTKAEQLAQWKGEKASQAALWKEVKGKELLERMEKNKAEYQAWRQVVPGLCVTYLRARAGPVSLPADGRRRRTARRACSSRPWRWSAASSTRTHL